jgi:uncharacterized cofD-like protein
VVSFPRGKVQLVRTFLRPGLGLKRWLALFGLGIVCFGLGIAFLTAIPITPRLLALGQLLTLKFLPPLLRGGIFIALGGLLLLLSTVAIYTTLEAKARRRRPGLPLVEAFYEEEVLRRGPRVVAIGGGTGLSTLLRGLKRYTSRITAIVTVADDGGSSGRLREELGIPPAGDARNCLVALAQMEPAMERLMDFRFPKGTGLQGHSMGNLLLAALTYTEGGFSQALDAASALLAVRGRVIPVADTPTLTLWGERGDGRVIPGESRLPQPGIPLKRVWLEPQDISPNPAALEAIAEADLIVIGPGSLFTSVIPNFLVPGIAEAVNRARAPKVFVCNVATQPGETEGFGVEEHLRAFREHTGVEITHLVVNSRVLPFPPHWNQQPVVPRKPPAFHGVYIEADLISDAMPTRHDPDRLARTLLAIGASRGRGAGPPSLIPSGASGLS